MLCIASLALFAAFWRIGQLRYIIEASLSQAHILNRTLILPSFVYARGCEFELSVLFPFHSQPRLL
jgi:hypothetical protein